MTKQTLVLTFAQPVKQVANNQITVEVQAGPDMWTREYMDEVCKQMGHIEGEKYLNELQNAADLKLVTASITSHTEYKKDNEIPVAKY